MVQSLQIPIISIRGHYVRLSGRVAIVAALAAFAFNVTPPAAGTADAASCVKIYKIYYDSPGADYRTASSLNAEWIQLKNTCTTSKSITGYKVKDLVGKTYTFGSLTLGAGKYVKLHTGTGTNSSTDRYWLSGNYIWNNDKDTAYLYNSAGTKIRTCSYTTASALPKAC
jgi:Lamin Tail Domain